MVIPTSMALMAHASTSQVGSNAVHLSAFSDYRPVRFPVSAVHPCVSLLVFVIPFESYSDHLSSSIHPISGVPNHAYALISDSHLQLNAFFGGRYGEYNGNPHKSLTWMRAVAFLFGHNVFIMEARSGSSASYESGYLARMALNGEDIPIPTVGDRLSLLNGELEVVQTKGGETEGSDLIDEFELRVGEKLEMRLVLRPEIEMLRTRDDGLVHFEVDVVKVQVSARAHGILGQTYRPDFAGRL